MLYRHITFQPNVLEEIVQSKKGMKRRIIMSTDIYGLCLMVNKETESTSKENFSDVALSAGFICNYETLTGLIIITIINNNTTQKKPQPF